MWPRGWVELYLYSSMTAALEGGEWSAARPVRTLPPRKEPVPILQEAGWAPGPVWTGGKSRPHRDSIPDRSACSSVAIPTELPGPRYIHIRCHNPQQSCTKKIQEEPYYVFNIIITKLSLGLPSINTHESGRHICLYS